MTTTIVIPQISRTEIYINQSGSISIMQPGEDHDDMIVLSCRSQAKTVVKAINDLLKIATFKEDEA